MEELHKKLLALLSDFDAFCHKHGIEYSLIYGSMLGAVRDKGFIPWDDDLDVVMDRKNYERLLNSLKEDNFSEKYKVIKPLWLTKICYLYEIGSIDLFVFYNVPNNNMIAFFKKYLVLMLQGMIKQNLSKRGSIKEQILSQFTWLLGKMFTNNFKNKLYIAVCKIGDTKKTEKVAIFNGIYKYVKTKQYSSKLLDEIIRIDFEEIETSLYKNYDYFLVETYGDYMHLPPKNERKPSHVGLSNSL